MWSEANSVNSALKVFASEIFSSRRYSNSTGKKED